MTSWHIETRGVEETLALGRRIGAALCDGMVIALVGPLGSGKTHLVKGVAVGNGLRDENEVTSPTFVLVNEYDGRLRLFHLDLYRIGSERELEALGFDEMQKGGNVVIVEWADRFPNAMPDDSLWISILAGDEEDQRRFQFHAGSDRSAAVLTAIAGGFEG